MKGDFCSRVRRKRSGKFSGTEALQHPVQQRRDRFVVQRRLCDARYLNEIGAPALDPREPADEARQVRNADCLGATSVLPMAALTLQEIVERGVALALHAGERSGTDRTDCERRNDSDQDPPASSCFRAVPAMTATEQV